MGRDAGKTMMLMGKAMEAARRGAMLVALAVCVPSAFSNMALRSA